MLTHLQIKNFKGWKDTGKLRLAPITVFFGTNSSGKSSIGQFLMMLKQTANSPDRSRVLHPGDDHSPVDLGTLDDIAHHHNIENDIQFDIGWEQTKELTLEDVLNKRKYNSREFSFTTQIGFEQGKGVKAVSRGFNYHLLDTSTKNEVVIGMAPNASKKGFDLTTENFNAVRKMGRAWPLSKPVRFFGFPDELIGYYQNADTLNDLPLQFQNILQDITYLGPLREAPKRHYPWSGDTPEDVGIRGERWVSAFLAAADRLLSGGYKKRNKPFSVLIAEQLSNLGLIDSFDVKPVAKGIREYHVKVKVTGSSSEVAVPDVGFGVSQILPVIVQSFYAKPNSTVIIEQPELHLHPAVQQKLSDLFIAAMQSREGGKDRRPQFILESHSEHFLRRLQRHIAEETIRKEDVAIYFCDQSKGRSSIVELEVDLYGNITNWPKDFFGDQMQDVAAAQKAQIQRRRNQPSQ